MPKDLKKRAAAILKILKRLFPHPKMALRWRTPCLPAGRPWQCMVAVQLSAQCTDAKVNEVTAKLFKKYKTLDDYVHAKPKEFERDIHSTGFYRNKTKNILAAAKMVQEKWHGTLPRTMKEMLEIPGVARKTANVVLGQVYGIADGIAVDTHVKRLSRQLGLTKQTDPDKIEQDLMRLFPKKEWITLNERLIAYGRRYSPATKKDHSDEPLAKFYVH